MAASAAGDSCGGAAALADEQSPVARKAPRPVVRALVVGVAGGATVAAGRLDALSKPGGPGLLWVPLLIAVGLVVLTMVGAGAVAYFTGNKDLADFHKNVVERQRNDEERRHNEAERQRLRDDSATVDAELNRLIKDRALILAAFDGIADAQNLVIARRGDPRLTESIGAFKQAATDAVASAAHLLQGRGDVGVRVMFAEYDNQSKSLTMDGSQFVAERGEFPANKLQRSELTVETSFPHLFESANHFAESADLLREGDKSVSSAEVVRMRSPDDPDHYVRVKVCNGAQTYGVLFIDMWGSTLLSKSDKYLILGISRILSSALAAVSPDGR